MSEDWPEKKHYPTHAEVREIIRVILERIDSAPDWSPPSLKVEPADETWKGWGRR